MKGGESVGRKDNGHPLGGRCMRASLSRFREFPLLVGPGFPGGAAFRTRFWQFLHLKNIDTYPKRQHQISLSWSSAYMGIIGTIRQ